VFEDPLKLVDVLDFVEFVPMLADTHRLLALGAEDSPNDVHKVGAVYQDGAFVRLDDSDLVGS